MAISSHLIGVTILHIEEVIFSILPIEDSQVLDLVLSNNSLLPLEVVAQVLEYHETFVLLYHDFL